MAAWPTGSLRTQEEALREDSHDSEIDQHSFYLIFLLPLLPAVLSSPVPMLVFEKEKVRPHDALRKFSSGFPLYSGWTPALPHDLPGPVWSGRCHLPRFHTAQLSPWSLPSTTLACLLVLLQGLCSWSPPCLIYLLSTRSLFEYHLLEFYLPNMTSLASLFNWLVSNLLQKVLLFPLPCLFFFIDLISVYISFLLPIYSLYLFVHYIFIYTIPYFCVLLWTIWVQGCFLASVCIFRACWTKECLELGKANYRNVVSSRVCLT